MRAYKKYRKKIIQDTTEEKKEENTEPKVKFIFSNYDSEGLARIVVGILEYRDKYCFEHLLKGCEKGFLPEEEFAHTNKWVNKDTGQALIRVLLIWGIITPLFVFNGWNGSIGYAVVWGILLFSFWAGVDHYLFGPERVQIGWYDFGEIPVWEDREDHYPYILKKYQTIVKNTCIYVVSVLKWRLLCKHIGGLRPGCRDEASWFGREGSRWKTGHDP